MKNTWLFLIIGLLILNAYGTLAVSENSTFNLQTISETIPLSEPILKDENKFVTIKLNEAESYILDTGEPMLPKVTRVFTLPFGSIISHVDVAFHGKNELFLEKEIKRATEPTLLDENIDYLPHLETNQNTNIFPQKNFIYRTGSGLSDNKHVLYLTLQCYPIQYDPSKNSIINYDSIDIEIKYFEGNGFPAAVDNYNLVVISTNAFQPSIQKLIDHKNNYGVTTLFKNVKEIYNEYPGRDEPEQIKYFIKDMCETKNTSYVLLIGDIKDVPIRMSSVQMWHDELEMPTDLYYGDLYDNEGEFCSWDANNNNIFGEFNYDQGNIDNVDLYADVYIGRIPCKTSLDLNVVINKIITYETTTYGSNWYKKILLLGGDTFPFDGPIEGEIVTDAIADVMDGFEPIRLWTSENTFTPMQINQKTSLGAGFISYSGHGYINGFGTSPPNVNKRIEYYNLYLFGMLNGNKLPIVFFDACHTATLDHTLFKVFRYPGFAYNIVRKPFGGGVAAIGATRVAFTHVDFSGIHGGAGFLNLHFFMNYKEGGTVAEMLTGAQYDYLNYVGVDCITLVEFILIGDPSLKTGGYL